MSLSDTPKGSFLQSQGPIAPAELTLKQEERWLDGLLYCIGFRSTEIISVLNAEEMYSPR